MLILDYWGMSFHPAVVVSLGNDLLFNSILGHCGVLVSVWLWSFKFGGPKLVRSFLEYQ